MNAIRRSTLRTAVLGALAAAVLGFHGAASAQVTGTIKIDAPLSLTGVAAFAGIAEKEGMDYAIEEINNSRFLGEAKLAANYVDVALATDQAVAAVRGFLRGDGVAIVGMTIGNHSLAVAPLAQQGKMPLIVANTGGIKDLTKPGEYVYQMDVGQYLYANRMGEALKAKGVKSTAVLYNDDVPAVMDLWGAYKDGALPQNGVKVTNAKSVVSTTADFSAAVTSLLEGNPDAIGLLARGGAVTVINQLRQAGYKGVIWGQAGLAGGVALKAAPATNGVLVTANAAAGSPYPSMESFFKGFKAKTGKDAFSFTAQGYDSVGAVARAIKTAGCTSRECVQKGLTALMNTGMDGALGKLTFKNRDAIGPGAVLQINNGKEEFVK